MPAAFNKHTMDALRSTVRSLFYRRQKIGMMTFTTEEYLATFVPLDLRMAFRECKDQIATHPYFHRWELESDGRKIDATLRTSKVTLPVPRVIRIQEDAPKEVTQRIKEWASRDGDPSREFGRVVKVLELLNDRHSRVAIRYYWPTILALLSECNSSATKELVQQLHELKQPARSHPLPPGLVIACKQTAETVATARLIPTDIGDSDNYDVAIAITTGQRYNEPLDVFWGMT